MNLLDKILQIEEIYKYLGHYNTENYSICLYDVPNIKRLTDKINFKISNITNKFRFIILDKKGKFTNINILDIGL